MDFKQILRAGYDTIAKCYLEERTQASEDVRLLDGLISRLPLHAKVQVRLTLFRN